MYPRFPLIAAAFALLLPLQAIAQDMMQNTPEAVMSVARGFGEIEMAQPDEFGNPVLDGEIDGLFYSIVIFDCDSGEGCLSAQFYASFINEDIATAEFANQWNRETRFLQAYLADDNSLVVSMAVNMRFGITRQNFQDNFDLWADLMQDFNNRVFGLPTRMDPPAK